MKKVLIIGLATAALGGSALAQVASLVPISVRAGYSYLTTGNSRDLTHPSGYTLGAGVELPLQLNGGRLSFDIDWDDHHGDGNTIQSLGFQGVIRMPFLLSVPTPIGKVGPYYGFGLGVFHDRVSGSTTTTVQSSLHPRGGAVQVTNFSDSETRFGGSILLGFQFTNLAAAELYYRLSGSVDGYKCDTIGLSVSVKF